MTEACSRIGLKTESRIEHEVKGRGGGRSTDNKVSVVESTTRLEEQHTLHTILGTVRCRPRPTKVEPIHPGDPGIECVFEGSPRGACPELGHDVKVSAVSAKRLDQG